MNTRRNTGQRVKEAAAGSDQAHPQAPSAQVQVPVNPAVLTNGEVREALVQMYQAITTQI